MVCCYIYKPKIKLFFYFFSCKMPNVFMSNFQHVCYLYIYTKWIFIFLIQITNLGQIKKKLVSLSQWFMESISHHKKKQNESEINICNHKNQRSLEELHGGLNQVRLLDCQVYNSFCLYKTQINNRRAPQQTKQKIRQFQQTRI